MSENSVNTRVDFTINGQPSNAPDKWTDIEVTAAFDEDAVQANITFDSFRFLNIGQNPNQRASNILRDWKTNDNPGILHGVPFQIRGFNNQNTQNVFDGYINMSDDAVFKEDGSTDGKIVKREGLDDFNLRIEALNWGYLQAIGKVTQADYISIDYVVEKKFNFLEILMSNVMLFLLTKELVENIRSLAEKVADATAHGSGGLSGPVAAAAWTIATIVIQAIYTALILVAVINLGNQLLETLLPRVRQHKVMQLRRAMEIVATHLGYNLVSPITELDDVYFLPSNPVQDDVSLLSGLITTLRGTPNGAPNVTDFGYNCLDFFSLIQDMVYGKFAVIGNDLHFRTFSDPFWQKTATYVLPDNLVEEERFNTDELKARFALLFNIDPRDDWTIDQYLGTAYEAQVDAINTPDVRANFINGLDENQLLWALGNRKDDLNGIERLIKSVAQFFDSIANTLGGSSNLAGKVNNKVGMLKVTDNNHSVPKLLFLQGGKLPSNHRSLFSAKVMYNKYHVEKSFVQNNFKAQKSVYTNVRVPFGFEDFLKLVDNSFFTDNQGRVGKVTSISWNMFGDFATISYWIREPWTTNLKETFIEAA